MKSVTFCGHSEVHDIDSIRRQLTDTVQKCIDDGAVQFYLGGYGGFDKLAASVVRSFKKSYPHIVSTLVLAYPDRKIDELDMMLYDDTVYPPLENVIRRYAISFRNRWMIEASDVVVAYVTHDFGGAYTTRKYAVKNNKPIIDIK